MEYILRFWDRYFFVLFFRFFLIRIYFQKSTHISRNILESQNSIHFNNCTVRDSKRNTTNPIVLASKLWDLQAISFGKKEVSAEVNYQRKYKQTPVGLCVCRASLSDLYASNYAKIVRECFLSCSVS